METIYYRIFFSCLLFSCIALNAKSQTKATFFDGTVIAGYVDHGAFINFTGPNIKYVQNKTCFVLGCLPSLRIKEDNVAPGATKNSTITPTLGFGLTASVKHIALQLPLYYNSKTAVKDGAWKLGIGLGYRF